MKFYELYYCLLLLIIFSCQYPELIRDDLVYENDFESKNLDFIDGGGITFFNNTNVIGNFNNDSFTIHLTDVGSHDYVFISFDLYIHGSWDGNFNGFSNGDKPDLWKLDFQPDMSLHQESTSNSFTTTFSNSPCWPDYCLRQSFPEAYPFENNPNTGSFKTGMPVVCDSNFFGGKTSLYKIEKTFKSSGNAVIFKFSDKLYQPNAIDNDGIPQQKCDESWSLDNLKIRVIKYK